MPWLTGIRAVGEDFPPTARGCSHLEANVADTPHVTAFMPAPIANAITAPHLLVSVPQPRIVGHARAGVLLGSSTLAAMALANFAASSGEGRQAQ